jgi:hypothetical protein
MSLCKRHKYPSINNDKADDPMSDINVVLAERTGTGTVKLCACNSIHLSIGPVTINMAPEMFAQAAGLVRQAMESLAKIVATGELEGEHSSSMNRHAAAKPN